MKPIYQKVGPEKRQIWTKLYPIEDSKSVVIIPSGSGEYRSVDMDFTQELAIWLNKQNYHCLAFDKFGCGESDGQWKNVTINDLVEDLIILSDFVKNNLNKKVIIFGHSEGSILAAEAAARSHNIDAIILRVASHQSLSERIKMQTGEKDWNEWLFELKNPADGQFFSKSHPISYWKSRLECELTGDILEKINIPTLAINGEKDTFTPPFAYQRIHDVLISKKNSKFKAVAIPEVGHSLTRSDEKWENSQAAIEVTQFLNDYMPVL